MSTRVRVAGVALVLALSSTLVAAADADVTHSADPVRSVKIAPGSAPDLRLWSPCDDGSTSVLRFFRSSRTQSARLRIVVRDDHAPQRWYVRLTETPAGVDGGTVAVANRRSGRDARFVVRDRPGFRGRADLLFFALSDAGERCSWSITTIF